MSVYDDLLSTLEVTHELITLVRRLVAAVVRLHNFPPLDGRRDWTSDTLDDLAQGFYAARPIEQRLTVLLAAAPDEAAFIAGLEASIVHYIQDELRKLPRGSVARTVRGVIKDHERFALQDGFVALADWPASRQPAQCEQAQLERAVIGVEITVPAWDLASTHRAPFADRPSIVALVEAILSEAGGPVGFNTVLDVVIGRCVIPELSREIPIGDYDAVDPPPAETSAYAAARAGEVWGQLTDQQRRALGALGGSVRDAAPHIGVAKTRAAEVLAEVRTILAEHLADDPAASDVARELLGKAADPDG